MKTNSSFMRLKGFIKKEALQVLRDPSSIGIAIVLPIVLLLIFGYGISLDAKHIPFGIVAENKGPAVNSFISNFFNSEYFIPVEFKHVQEANAAIDEYWIQGFIWIKDDFEKKLLAKSVPKISLIVNGVDANTARLIEGYVQGIWAKWIEQNAIQSGLDKSLPVELDYRIWFNQEVRSKNFLVPGLIAIIMTLIGALLTALIIAREWERGTMESLLVTPITVKEFILGKLIPYFVLGMAGMILSLVMAIVLFHVPFRGSFAVLFVASALFLTVALGMGLLISTIAKNQFVAAQAAIIVTFLPAFILSGFIFDLSSIPNPIRTMTHVIAARYFVAILQTVFLAGNVWSVIIPNCAALVLMAFIFLFLVAKRTSKRLQ